MVEVITVSSNDHKRFLFRLKRIISNYNVKHTVIIDNEGIGQSRFRNQAIKDSKANIIAFMDADDYPKTGWYANLAKGEDVKYYDYTLILKDNTYQDCRTVDYDKELLKERNIIPFSGSVVRAEIAKQCYFPEISYGNDWVFWAQVAKITDNFVHIPEMQVIRRGYTSYKTNIPIYRHIKRLYKNKQARKIVKSIIK